MGAVAQTDMAIQNEAHSRGLIKTIKNEIAKSHTKKKKKKVFQKGLHEWIGSIDLNSRILRCVVVT